MHKIVPAMPVFMFKSLFGKGRHVPFPLGHAQTTLWYSARAAIWQGVHALGLHPGERVLVPAYACGSEIDVLLKSGLILDYYRIMPDLRVDLDHVARLCTPSTRALFVTHYFGFAQPMHEICPFASDRGLLLLEDNAHGLYSTDESGQPLGSFGDIGIFSFTKSVPVPDGGALVFNGRDHQQLEPAQAPSCLAVAGKSKYVLEQALQHQWPQGTSRLKAAAIDPGVSWLKRYLKGASASPEAEPSQTAAMRLIELKLERARWGMSSLSHTLLGYLLHEDIRESRLRNYLDLGSKVHDGKAVTPFLRDLPRGTCPLLFPVRVADAEGLQRFLLGHNVRCKRFWSFFHDAMPMDAFPFEKDLKQTVLALPIHQGLGASDMDRLAALLNRWNEIHTTRAAQQPVSISGSLHQW